MIEILTKEDLEEFKAEIQSSLERIEKIITGTIAPDNWVDAAEAKRLLGVKSDATLKKMADDGKVNTKAKSGLPNAQKAYSKIDCMKHSKLMNHKFSTL